MATADWATVGEPERRYASLFAERKGLHPPVNIDKVLREYADIQWDSLPAGDAVMLRHGHRRPLVIVDESQTGNRLRFTLAHELGHIVLPWQIGTAFCHPEGTLIADGDFHVDLEAQANRFATELLIPRDWIVNRLRNDSDSLAERIIEIAKCAGVSPITLSIAFEIACPFAAAVCITHRLNKPTYQSRSRTWRLRKELAWWDSPKVVKECGGKITRATFGDYTLHAITVPETQSTTVRQPKKSPAEILDRILSKMPASQQSSLQRQINGVIGAANNYPEASSSTEALYELLRQRFLGKASLMQVTSHRLFTQFLQAKAHELFTRRKDYKKTDRHSG